MFRRTRLCSKLLCGLMFLAAHAYAGSDTPPAAPATNTFVPDPEIEELIEHTSDKDSAAAKIALDKLIASGAAGERHLQHHLQTDTGPTRVKYAELLAKCGKSKVGYRVTLELQPDGSGTLTLWSDRTILAECGKHFDRLMGQPERTYTDEDLRQNLYSKVDLIKFMDEGMKHLEARVDAPPGAGRSIETIGLLSFKSFDSLANFANGFDSGGFYMLAGATLYDTEPGVRAYRFHKGRETNKDLYAKNLLLFYNIRWEFVLDVKAKIRNSNATRTDGTKQIWNFDICQMLRGETQIEVSFETTGVAPRPVPTEDTAVALPAQVQGNQPVAIPAKRLIHARACKKSGSWQELVEHNQLVELDARNSIGRGGPLQYHWSQISGPDLALTPEALAKDRLGMRIPEPGEYRFELTVSSNGVFSKPAEVVVQVEEDPSEAPKETHTDVAASPQPQKTPAPAPTPAPEPHKTDLASANTPPAVKTTDAVVPATPKSIEPVPVKQPEPKDPPPVKVDAAKAKELYAQAVKLMKTGNYKEAKPLLNDALAGSPQDMQIAFDLAVTLFELNELPQSMLKFEEVLGAGDNAQAMMYVGHCNARAGAMDDAREWYRRGTAAGKSKVSWEIMWNYGAAMLKTKDYSSALTSLEQAESQAAAAKVNDYRLHRDLATALHGVQQDDAASKHLAALKELGYTPDPTLAAEVAKAAGKPAPAAPTETNAEPKKPEPTAPPKSDTVKNDPPKVEPKTVETKKPEPAPAPKVDTAKVEPPPTQPSPAKTPDKTAVTEQPAVKPAPPKADPPKPNPTRTAVTPKPKKDPRPVYPKKPLPPIPKDFESALAAGKRAFQDALGHAALKTEDDKIKAAQAFDEAEAMYRGAWALKPGEEAVISAFRELSEYIGAIALVKNEHVQTKAKGLVVLDAEASIGPKDKPLYCVWEQVDGEDLGLRPESLADKTVKFKIRKPGIYKFELAVSDGVRGGNPLTVTVEVEE
jgi:tetratricopeptide (TPR) repeat protein